MKKLITSIVMAIIAFAALVQVNEKFQAKTFNSTGIQLPYRILYPKNFDTAQQFPLVLFLHGSGERGSDNQKQLIHGAKLFATDLVMECYPAIVVFPQCPADSYWANIVEQKQPDGSRTFDFPTRSKPTPAISAVMQLIDSLVRLSYVDRNRIYVGGLSMGGMGTFELLARRPKMFAAAFPICGGGNPKSAKRQFRKPVVIIFSQTFICKAIIRTWNRFALQSKFIRTPEQ